MFARSQQISSPLLLPVVGSVLTTGLIASLLVVRPLESTLSVQQLLLRAAADLTLAACVHAVTVWAIWRLIREYVEPSAGTLSVHVWAVVVWLPLIVMLSADRSLWLSCIVPWAFANAVTFLNLWSEPGAVDEAPVFGERNFFESRSAPALWRTLLPFCITIVLVQVGLASAALGHPWSAAALLSAGVMLFLLRQPLMRRVEKSRRRFSRFSVLQTAAVFFLISTALTPSLQRAYGLRFLALYVARSSSAAEPKGRVTVSSDYSGIVLTLPARAHARMEAPKRSEGIAPSANLRKPVVIPFDGAYWYFKLPDTRPKADAHREEGDPIKANVRSTDRRELAMEAHQVLASSLSGDCCRGIRVALLNGDDRVGVIRVELLLRDRLGGAGSSVSLGSVAIASSESRHISLRRAPVAESLLFTMPEAARGRRFDEITVVIRPSSERALAGSKVAIQSFVLMP